LVLAALPLLASYAAAVVVLALDWLWYFAGWTTISDATRSLYAEYGVVVPLVMFSVWFLFVGLVTGALAIHFFAYKY
jgi:hypothetical protein